MSKTEKGGKYIDSQGRTVDANGKAIEEKKAPAKKTTKKSS